MTDWNEIRARVETALAKLKCSPIGPTDLDRASRLSLRTAAWEIVHAMQGLPLADLDDEVNARDQSEVEYLADTIAIAEELASRLETLGPGLVPQLADEVRLRPDLKDPKVGGLIGDLRGFAMAAGMVSIKLIRDIDERRKSKPSRQRPTNRRAVQLAITAARVFTRYTGRQPGFTNPTSSGGGKPSGQAVIFMTEIFDAAGVTGDPVYYLDLAKKKLKSVGQEHTKDTCSEA